MLARRPPRCADPAARWRDTQGLVPPQLRPHSCGHERPRHPVILQSPFNASGAWASGGWSGVRVVRRAVSRE